MVTKRSLTVLLVIVLVGLTAPQQIVAWAMPPIQTMTAYTCNHTFSVDDTLDESDVHPDDGICADYRGKCTLRAAVEEANYSSGADCIILEAKIYLLTRGELDVRQDLTITGVGASGVISGGDRLRVLYVRPTVTLTLQELTLADGLADDDGGCIENWGTVDIVTSTLTNCQANLGGGISNKGTLRIANSAFLSNTALVTTTTISGGGGGIFNYTGTVTIRNSTLAYNSAQDGGGIVNAKDGTVVITNTRFFNNSTTHSGGGLYNEGTVRIASSTFFSNTALAITTTVPGGGGGILNYGAGTVTIENTTLSANRADYGGGIHNSSGAAIGIQMDAETNSVIPGASTLSGNFANKDGGGIYNEGIVKIANSAFSGNRAGVGGGGIINYQSGEVTIRDGTLASNSAPNGGGIENGKQGKVTIINTTLIHNSATFNGGGIWNSDAGAVAITNSTLSGNTAFSSNPAVPAGGGGISNSDIATVTIRNTTLSGNRADYGGGIHNSGGGTVDINNDRGSSSNYTFSGNSATGDGGGIYNEGTVKIANSTLYYNQAHGGAGIINWESGSTDIRNSALAFNLADSGGGVSNGISGMVTITNTTLSNNSASFYGGGIVNYVTNTVGKVDIYYSTLAFNSAPLGGGSINNYGQVPSSVRITGSIVAYSPTGGDCSDDMITSGGYNLSSDGSCNFTAADDLKNTDPLLGPLVNNCGWTQAHTLLPDSPAIDRILPDANGKCGVETDQCGEVRPQGGQCDIGAVEIPLPLDTFDRPNGALGSNWSGPGASGGYQISENQLDVATGGPIYWRRDVFGSAQEVFITLVDVDPNGSEQDLILKVQGDTPNWRQGAIEVLYDAGNGEVHVETYQPGHSAWAIYAPRISVTFENGDQFGARVTDSGAIQVYRNGVLIGTVDMNVSDRAFFNGRGGRIGLWFINADEAILDDFGGGTLAP